jgi:hypothetical protein
MADPAPRTKAGKQRKVATVMHEFGQDKLKSSSGRKVTNPKQAVAIALSESGQSNGAKPPPERLSKGRRRGGGDQNARLANRIDRGVDQRQQRNNRR